jgi:hypothetical protein
VISLDNPFGPAGKYDNQYLAAKEGRADYSRNQKERTDIERMERQADFLASAILMPKPALREAFKNYFASYGEKPRQIIRGHNPTDDFYAKQLPEYIAKIFNVSNRAALIRLEKLTAIIGKFETIYAYCVYGNVPEFMPNFAFKRDKHFSTFGKKIIKCPYCRKTFTTIDITDKVEIHPHSKKAKVVFHEVIPCKTCNSVVGIIYAGLQSA